MATTAAGYGYGYCSAGLPPFALFPVILSTRRSPPPPPRVSLVDSSSKLRAPAPRCAPF
jgi:protein import protein ZIM17